MWAVYDCAPCPPVGRSGRDLRSCRHLCAHRPAAAPRSAAQRRGSASRVPRAELIPGGGAAAAMAVTVDAPPSAVWPWLVQMGCDRGGLVRLGPPRQPRRFVRRARHREWAGVLRRRWGAVHAERRHLVEVAALEPGRFLALRAPIDLHGGRPFDAKGLRPRLYTGASGLPAEGAAGGPRRGSVVSGYVGAAPANASGNRRLPCSGSRLTGSCGAAVRRI